MHTTPQLDTALQGFSPLVFGAVEILLPSYNLRLLDGAGTLSFSSKTFVGRDATYGVLAAVDAIRDGAGDQAPSVTITLLPSDDAAAVDLAEASMQGSPVSIWVGAVDPATGLVIPDPDLVFFGELDQPTIKASDNSRSLEWTVVSVFDRFFDLEEGQRLASGFHQSVWAGELGMDFVTGVDEDIYWGVERKKSSVKSSKGLRAAVTTVRGG